MKDKRLLEIHYEGHYHIYRYAPEGAKEALLTIYLQSRRTGLGFSLRLVIEALRKLSHAKATDLPGKHL